MARLNRRVITWATNNWPILILLLIYVSVGLIAWAYDKYGPEVGRIPLSLFLLGSLIGILAESGTRNLTKGGNIRATLKMTYLKTVRDDNGAELLLITIKWAAFSTAGIALATMVANLA